MGRYIVLTNNWNTMRCVDKYLIYIFVKTKLDNFDGIELPVDYVYMTKNSNNFVKKSGGIAIIYKKMSSKSTFSR